VYSGTKRGESRLLTMFGGGGKRLSRKAGCSIQERFSAGIRIILRTQTAEFKPYAVVMDPLISSCATSRLLREGRKDEVLRKERARNVDLGGEDVERVERG
jgi:hypothetical protein